MPQVDCAWPDAVTLYFVRSIRIIIFVHVSNFCLDRPFGFLVLRDAHFCLSRLFRFSAYRAVLLIFLFDWFFVYFDKVFLDCTGMRVCQCFVVTRVIAHGPSWLGIYLPRSLVGKIVYFLAQDFSCNPRGRAFLMEVCFNLSWYSCTRLSCILSSIQLEFQQNSDWRNFDDLHVVYWGTEGGLPLLKCALEVWW